MRGKTCACLHIRAHVFDQYQLSLACKELTEDSGCFWTKDVLEKGIQELLKARIQLSWYVVNSVHHWLEVTDETSDALEAKWEWRTGACSPVIWVCSWIAFFWLIVPSLLITNVHQFYRYLAVVYKWLYATCIWPHRSTLYFLSRDENNQLFAVVKSEISNPTRMVHRQTYSNRCQCLKTKKESPQLLSVRPTESVYRVYDICVASYNSSHEDPWKTIHLLKWDLHLSLVSTWLICCNFLTLQRFGFH